MSRTSEKKLSLEENFERLDGLVEKLSEEDISLEDAFSAYSEGMKVLKLCNEQIDRVDKKVLKLGEQGELEELDSI